MTTATPPIPARPASGRAQPPRRRRFRGRISVVRGAAMALMLLCALATTLPLLVVVFDGLKSTPEIVQNPIAPPTSLHWDNLRDAWNGGGLGSAPLSRAFLNSVLVTAGTTTAVTLVAALAGYALGTAPARFDRLVTLLILILLAVPTQATLIPVYDLLGRWQLRNNLVGILLVYSAFWLPFSVLLLRAAFRGFPRELIEAARVDGAGEVSTFLRIVVPILRGPIIGVAIVNAVGIWSELLFAYVLLTDPAKQTLPTAIIAFQGNFTTDYRLLYAGLLISVVPVLVFYGSLSSVIRKGISAGALK